MSEFGAARLATLASAACRPDTRELTVVHRFLRREFDRLPAAVGQAPPQAADLAADLSEFFDLLAGAVDRHHVGTDGLLWPLVTDRTGGEFGPADRALEQHQRLAELLSRGRDGFGRWQRFATATARDQLADTLAAVAAMLSRQLDDTEAELEPLVVAHLTVAEWERFADHEQAGVPRERLPELLNCLLADADAADRGAILSRHPVSTRLLWFSCWRYGLRRRGSRRSGRDGGPLGGGLPGGGLPDGGAAGRGGTCDGGR